MSQTVDSRVVELKFDAKKFKKDTEIAKKQLDDFSKDVDELEKAFKDLYKDLNVDKLVKFSKKAYKGTKSFVEDAKEEFLKFDKACQKFVDKHTFKKTKDDVDNMSSSINKAGKSFKVLETVATGALLTIGNKIANIGTKLISGIISPITTGGLQRAQNIEQATFQFEGMNVSKSRGNEDKAYYAEVMDAVTGTAYSYDVAAKAASQLAASNIGVTKTTRRLADGTKIAAKEMNGNMTKALLGIAGVASMTGSNFDDIAQIFTRVAGQGKVMANDLNSIAARGLNAAAVLGASMGKTEKEIRELVSKGKISFADFSKAMSDAYGSHAKDSTKMFTGALEDTKAALSRIGADFFTPYLTAARDVLNSITPFVDVMHEQLMPTINALGVAMKKTSKTASQFFDLMSFGLADDSKSWADENIKRFANIVDRYSGLKDTLMAWYSNEDMFSKSIKVGGKYKGKSKVHIDFNKMMMDQFSIDKKTLKEMIQNGSIGITEVYEALSDLMMKSPKLLKNTAFNDAVQRWIRNIVGDYADLSKEQTSSDSIKRMLVVLKRVKTIATGIKDIFKSVKNVLGSVLKLIGALLTALSPVFEFVVDIIAKIAKTVDNLFNAISSSERITSIFQLLENVLFKLGEQIKSWRIFETVANGLEKALKGVETVLMALYNGFKSVLKAVVHFVDTIVENLDDVLASLAKIIQALKIGGLFALIALLGKLEKALKAPAAAVKSFGAQIKSMGKDIRSVFKSFATVAKQFAEGMKAIVGVLKEAQEAVKAFKIIEIAVAIFILAGALFFLSKIKISNAADALGPLIGILATVGVLLTVVGILSVLAEKIKKLKAFKNIGELTKTFYNLAIAIAILAVSIAVLSKCDTGKMLAAAGVIEVLVLTLTGIMALLSSETENNFLGLPKKSKSMVKGTRALIGMAIAVAILAKAIKNLSDIKDPNALGMSFLVIEMLMGTLTVMLKVLSSGDKKTKGFIGAAISLIAMAEAIRILVKAMEGLSKIPEDSMIRGLIGIIVLMGALTGLMKWLSGSKGLIGAGIGILLVCEGLKVLAGVLGDVSALNPDALATSIGALAFVLLIMVGAFKLLDGTKVFGTAVAMLMLSASIKILSGILVELGNSDPEVISQGLKTLGIVIGGLAAACFAFSKIPGKGILKFLGSMIGLDVALAGLGIALILVGFGITSMATALKQLASIPTDQEHLKSLAIGLAAIVGSLAAMDAVGIGAALPLILIGGALLLMGIAVKKASEGFENIVISIKELSNIDTTAFASSAASILSSLKKIAKAKGLASSLTESTAVINDAFGGLQSAANKAAKATNKLGDSGKTLVSSFAMGVSNSKSILTKSINTLMKASVAAIKTYRKQYETAGSYLAKGLVVGLNDQLHSVKTAASNLASAAELAIRKTGVIKSPSHVWRKLGNYFGLGLIKGFDDSENGVTAASENLATTASAAIASISSILNSDIDMSPRIRPVMDLNDVYSGVDSINGLMKDTYSTKMAANISGVSSNAVLVDKLHSVQSSIGSLGSDLRASDDSNVKYVFETPTYLDGKLIAKGTASYTKAELDKIQIRADRAKGKR